MTDDYQLRAKCRGHENPDLWFPNGRQGPALLQEAEAKAICAVCPVSAECLLGALDRGDRFGIFAGINFETLTAAERGSLLDEIQGENTPAAA